MSNAAIDFIAANPRSTAREAGLTNAEVNALVGQGKLIPVGNRVTGKKGRPPMEYVVPGADVSEDSMAQESIREAVERVERHRDYERKWATVLVAYREFGYGSPEHAEAKALLHEAYPKGMHPATPSKNDYVLAGAAADTSVGVEDDDAEVEPFEFTNPILSEA